MSTSDTQNPKPPTLVTAGVIFNEGKVLIAQRKKGDRLAGKWEFPGGKVEPKEKPKDCLIRELKEELGIEVEVIDIFHAFIYQYPWGKMQFIAYLARLTPASREPEAIECEDYRWVPIKDLPAYDFVPADWEIVGELLKLIAIH